MLACPICSYLSLIFQLQNIMIWRGTFNANTSYYSRTTGSNTAVRKQFRCSVYFFVLLFVLPISGFFVVSLTVYFSGFDLPHYQWVMMNNSWIRIHFHKRENKTTCPAAWTRESHEEALCREVPSMEFQ